MPIAYDVPLVVLSIVIACTGAFVAIVLASRRAFGGFQLPTRGAIDGRFACGQNVLRTVNPYLHFRMDSTASGFYETAVSGRAPDTTSRSERFDIVTGSGRKGQSYLCWHGDQLYQLPISYWRGLGWINSPGYQDGGVNSIGRSCHAAWNATPLRSSRCRS